MSPVRPPLSMALSPQASPLPSSPSCRASARSLRRPLRRFRTPSSKKAVRYGDGRLRRDPEPFLFADRTVGHWPSDMRETPTISENPNVLSHSRFIDDL